MTNKWDGEATNFSNGDTLPAVDLNDTFTAVANATIVGVYSDTDSTDNSTNSTSYVDTNLSITQTTSTNKCLVFFTAAISGSGNAGSDVLHSVQMLMDATVIAATGVSTNADTEIQSVTLVALTDTLTAASHTFKIQFKTANATYATELLGSTVETSRLTVIEIKV